MTVCSFRSTLFRWFFFVRLFVWLLLRCKFVFFSRAMPCCEMLAWTRNNNHGVATVFFSLSLSPNHRPLSYRRNAVGTECTLPPVKITIGFLKCTEVDRSHIINSALQTNVRWTCISAEAGHGGISLGFSKNGWLKCVCVCGCVPLFRNVSLFTPHPSQCCCCRSLLLFVTLFMNGRTHT